MSCDHPRTVCNAYANSIGSSPLVHLHILNMALVLAEGST